MANIVVQGVLNMLLPRIRRGEAILTAGTIAGRRCHVDKQLQLVFEKIPNFMLAHHEFGVFTSINIIHRKNAGQAWEGKKTWQSLRPF